jgi:hypothetical protein
VIPSVNVPEGTSGEWRVTHTVISAEQAALDALRFSINPGRYVIPVEAGTITRLICNGRTVMSDTPSEKRDHAQFVARAQGRVLIAGLGLGMVACAVAAKKEVSTVTVLEISEDVIKLVGRSLPAKVGVVLADIRIWKPDPGEIWDCMWIDIWNDICGDNLPEMTRLKRRFCKRVRTKIECWSESRLRIIRRRDRRDKALWIRRNSGDRHERFVSPGSLHRCPRNRS